MALKLFAFFFKLHNCVSWPLYDHGPVYCATPTVQYTAACRIKTNYYYSWRVPDMSLIDCPCHVSVQCSQPQDIDVNISWVLRHTPCSEEYINLETDKVGTGGVHTHIHTHSQQAPATAPLGALWMTTLQSASCQGQSHVACSTEYVTCRKSLWRCLWSTYRRSTWC